MAPGDFESLLEQGIPSVSAVDLQEILVDVLQSSWPHRVTAQFRREDAVGVGAALLWVIFVVASAYFNWEGLLIQPESLAGGFVALFQHSS